MLKLLSDLESCHSGRSEAVLRNPAYNREIPAQNLAGLTNRCLFRTRANLYNIIVPKIPFCGKVGVFHEYYYQESMETIHCFPAIRFPITDCWDDIENDLLHFRAKDSILKTLHHTV